MAHKEKWIGKVQVERELEAGREAVADKSAYQRMSLVRRYRMAGDVSNPRIILESDSGKQLFSISVSRPNLTQDEIKNVINLYKERMTGKIMTGLVHPKIGNVDSEGFKAIMHSNDLEYTLYKDKKGKYTVEDNSEYSIVKKISADNDGQARKMFSLWLLKDRE